MSGFPVKYIDFGGEKRPVKYGMNTLSIISRLAKAEGVEWANITPTGEGVDFGLVRIIVFAGMQEGARAEKKGFTLTLEDIGDYLDPDVDRSEEFVLLMSEQMPKSKKVTAPK